MTEKIIKILVQLIRTLSVVTKQIKQGRLSESIVIDDALLDLMVHREIRKETFWR